MFVAPLQNALLFTVNTLFNIYISIVLFRFLLQLVHADLYNPISQFVVKVTNPLLRPLQKVIPRIKNIDVSPILVALLLQAVAITLELVIKGFNINPSIGSLGGLFIWSFGALTDTLLVIFLFAIVIQVVASWLQPGQYNSTTAILAQITEPLVNPVRRIIPTAGVIDFSPMIVMFVLLLLRTIVPVYIITLGQTIL